MGRVGRKKERGGPFTFSTSDFETKLSLATSKFTANRPLTAFISVTLCSSLNPPRSRSFTSVNVSKWCTYGGACKCGALCSSGFSVGGAPICRIVSSGLAARALFSPMGLGDGCLGWDSAASSSVARVAGSRVVVLIAASREMSGVSFALSLGFGVSFVSDSFDGGATVFFCSDLLSPFTSLSMTPASDFSPWGFEGMPGGG